VKLIDEGHATTRGSDCTRRLDGRADELPQGRIVDRAGRELAHCTPGAKWLP